jgi:plasmid maintenance system antidote protein VapI
MKIIEQLERLELLHKLIEQERTGDPNNLANRLGISRSALYNLIDELKSYEVSISYSRIKQSFVYDGDISLEIQYSVKVIKNEEEEMVKLDGGGFLNWAAYQAGKAVGTIEAFLQSVIDAE